MKGDKYLKIILTIIALCLLWICLTDVGIFHSKAYAQYGTQDVRVVYISPLTLSSALLTAEPIKVKVVNPSRDER